MYNERTTEPRATDTYGVREQSFMEWLHTMRANWRQGEHVAIIGPTGKGKTTLARYLLAIRSYVVVLAVKHHDDTIGTFRHAWHEAGDTSRILEGPYSVITRWPPRYHQRKIVYWIRPKDLRHDPKQADKVYVAMNHVFHAGGWCLFLDDVGYIAGILKLKAPIATMFSQGRSNNNSIVAAMTQPSSVAQQIPTEAFRQVRYMLMFRFGNRRDVAKVAEMSGVDVNTLLDLNDQLGKFEFLSIREGDVTLVHGRDETED